MIGVSIIKIATVKRSVDGTTNTRAIFRQDLPREISCRLDWKSNSRGAAHSRRGSKNDCNPVQRNSSEDYRHRLLIAHTF
jgi:hypothetical protein